MTQQQDDLQGREPPMAVVEGVKKERSSSAGHGRRATGDGRRATGDGPTKIFLPLTSRGPTFVRWRLRKQSDVLEHLEVRGSEPTY
jgi:hypothetical protein